MLYSGLQLDIMKGLSQNPNVLLLFSSAWISVDTCWCLEQSYLSWDRAGGWRQVETGATGLWPTRDLSTVRGVAIMPPVCLSCSS